MDLTRITRVEIKSEPLIIEINDLDGVMQGAQVLDRPQTLQGKVPNTNNIKRCTIPYQLPIHLIWFSSMYLCASKPFYAGSTQVTIVAALDTGFFSLFNRTLFLSPLCEPQLTASPETAPAPAMAAPPLIRTSISPTTSAPTPSSSTRRRCLAIESAWTLTSTPFLRTNITSLARSLSLSLSI